MLRTPVMPVVCGTDFSPPATDAVAVAGVFARRMREPLSLVHVVDTRGAREDLSETARERAREALRHDADRERGLGATVEDALLGGAPDEALVEHAQRVGAGLVVTGALGYRSPARWHLGGVAERVAQRTHCPVLVVRRAAAFAAWDRGDRPLRVLVAVDLSSTSDATIRWAAGLRDLGPCEIVVAHLYRPGEERRRFGFRAPLDADAYDREVQRLLARELRARVQDTLGEAAVRVEPARGEPAEELVGLAEWEEADLLVVGTHRRGALGRLWHGSVSHGIMERAPMAVACVPAPSGDARAIAPLPSIRRVLVPTDLSPLGNRAVPHAFGLVQPGGTVHLLHVIEPHELPNPLYAHYTPGRAPTPEERARQRADLTARLQELIPPEAAARRIGTELEVVAGEEVAAAIGEMAQRLGVDAICLSSHGRSGVSRALAGSVAQRVMTESRTPLFVVRPPPA